MGYRVSGSTNFDNYGSAKVGQRVRPDSRKPLLGRRWYDGLKVPEQLKTGVIRYGPLVLDNDRKTVRVEGDAITIAPKLFELLRVFMSNPGKVLSHAELAVSLWPDDDRADPGDVKQHIYLLRKTLETDPSHPRWIQNARGFGYKLIIHSEGRQSTVDASPQK